MRRGLALRGLAVLLILGLGGLGYARADAPRWGALSTLLMWTKAAPTGPTEVTAADPLPVTITGAVAGTITPSTNDGAALGTGALSWSDLFLASGGVINWDNGDVTLTHSSGLLTLSSPLTLGTYLSVGPAPATVGAIRLEVGGIIYSRNTAGGGNIQLLYLSGNDQIVMGENGVHLAPAGTTQDLGDPPNANIWRNLYLSGPKVTAGSGTGVTISDQGSVRSLVYKVTVTSANCIAAATTCDLTIATLPAKTFLKAVIADLTTVYACTAVCTSTTLSGTLGTSAGGTQLLASMDLDAAAAQFGDADAELGATMNAAARSANGALFNGVLMSWSGTTTVTYRITSGTGNLGDGAATNLSQGTIVFYLVTEVFP